MGGNKFKGMFETEYTIFAGLVGSTFVTMATHGTDQDMVQRMLTAPDVRRSRRSLILSGLADIPIAFVLLSVGVLLFAHYTAHPDPNLPKAHQRDLLLLHPALRCPSACVVCCWRGFSRRRWVR